ncbi:MAG TPA: prepilin-type N-terminal cleavage/methylation domain-containing protein [Lacipirellulaceae bacterium]|nr:prepilin-type N-terminal cleavage/methylation domain-containing protein [Lacipirellulaceae bacterium]
MRSKRRFQISVGGNAECHFDRRGASPQDSVWRPTLIRVRDRKALRAFTLLEIIISLAILAGSLAALGEVMRSAGRSGSMAADETQAQILAASIMDELQAGSRELAAVDNSPLDTPDDPPWVYSIEMDPTDYDELVAVHVRVEQQLDVHMQPAHFELVRWMPNPDYTPSTDASSDMGTTGSTTQ